MPAIDPATGELTGGDITAQSEQFLANSEATLTAAVSNMDRVVRATCVLANFDDFPAFNVTCRQAFSGDMPARSNVEVADLDLGALVEIEFNALV